MMSKEFKEHKKKIKKRKKGGNRGQVKGKLTRKVTFYLQSLKAEYQKGEQNKNDGQVITTTNDVGLKKQY